MARFPLGATGLTVLVPEAEPIVAGPRSRYDVAAQFGMPAHVTVLYPWLPRETLGTGDLEAVSSLARATASFESVLARTARFPRTLWLEPTPADPFRVLTEAVARRWPQAQPYDGEFETVVPHLTVAHEQPEEVLTAVAAEVSTLLPVTFWATALVLHEFDGVRWVERDRFAFGGSSED
ncbi:2'-5' RNA ligase family protein [Occultella gossypii]|uniref:2'-5' RNA ligase family protein n=1 Tax=Occultella gossypii TaxID=2800820 RepID=A0ABS7S902_9MICO|nr:2'-5' RNA ligase family protein [Occultella gossypii]MBZ2196104.1 2'-5' RNA ligase family protein [Occultella gossypii]